MVRLWDPRSGQQIGRLTGHTDNIRTLLISEDGSHVSMDAGFSDMENKLTPSYRYFLARQIQPSSCGPSKLNDAWLRMKHMPIRCGPFIPMILN